MEIERWIQLAGQSPAQARHLIDLPYRLGSDALADPANWREWHDGGQLRAWAIWQQPWISLDYAIDPDAGLEEEVLSWGLARFREMARHHGRALDYYVDAREDDAPRIALLERLGFAWDPQGILLHLVRTLSAHPTTSPLPAGFTSRALLDGDDVARVVDLQRLAFDSTNMTVEWRQRIRRLPQYTPGLDLVIVAPDGALAAFCIGWLRRDAAGVAGQIEPMGVHPAYHRLGLGRAILTEALRRMQAYGATTAHVECYGANTAGYSFYRRAGGFALDHTIRRYYRNL